MKRSSLKFNKGRDLHFLPKMDEFLDIIYGSSRLNQFIDDCLERRILNIYIFSTEKGLDESILDIKDILSKSFNVSVIDLENYEEENFDYFKILNKNILTDIKKGSGIFLFSQSDENKVEAIIATLLVSLQIHKTITPRRAIQYVAGDLSQSIPEAIWLYKYLNLDLPDEIQKFIEEDSQTSTKSPEDLVEEEFQENEFQENEFQENEFQENEFQENEFQENEFQENEFQENEFQENEFQENEFQENEFQENEFQENEFQENEFQENEFQENEFQENEFQENEFQENEFQENEFQENEFQENEFQEFGSHEVEDNGKFQKSLIETPPPSSTRSEGETSKFKLSRFTIKTKMLGIISSIIIISMSIMIFLASYWFRADMRRLVQTNNLETAAALGGKVEADFQRIINNAKLFAISDNTKRMNKIFFESNPDILFVAVAVMNDEKISFKKESVNAERLKKHKISNSQISNLHESNLKYFKKSFNGQTVVENISPGSPIPLFGISTRISEKEILLIYAEAESIILLFGGDEDERVSKIFLVNSAGDVLAHPDVNLIRARTNLADLEIVSELIKSKVRQGLKQYTDSEGNGWLGSYAKFEFGSFGIVSLVQEDRVFASVNKLTQRNLIILMIAVTIALLIVFYFSKTITNPIRRLVDGIRRVERGDYNIQLNVKSHDEMGLLGNSFEHMARGLDEREKMKDAFGKFVNKDIAEKAMRGELKLGGEKKECAVFFSDLRGFTAMSEGMLPEQVVDFLNEYFTGMVKCVNDTNGVVDKFIGDAVMAHWGAIESYGNDTENAINASIMMRKTLIQFNERGAGNRPYAKMGCGINTGPVIAGQIGSNERLEFTVIGDAVNLASRIEALNKPFGTDILISTDALSKVEGIFKVVEMPAIKVKGKSEPQHIYAVLGRLDDPETPDSLEELRAILKIEFDSAKKAHNPEEGEVKYEILQT